jgi:glycosyltransferase involved in cell wall biosynthesis
MKTAFVIHVRNKANDIRRAAECALGQSYGPMEIIFSDQGSTDGTLEILKDIAARYDGPQTVRVLECPHTELKGHPGMNAHVNWIHDQSDADIFLMASGDDYSLGDRAEKMVRAFETHKPDMVLTGIYFVKPDDVIDGYSFYPEEDGWVKTEDLISKCIGGSSSMGWTRDFFKRAGGLQGTMTYDVVLPFLATLMNGCYYLKERLHCYVAHASEENTGLEGQLRAATTDEKKSQLEELMHYQITSNLCMLAKRVEDLGLNNDVSSEALFGAIVGRAYSWANARERLTLSRTQPMGLSV